MGNAKSFRDLLVWQKAHQLVIDVYKMTKCLPSDERFGLALQTRRSAVSIPANIAEGFVKRSIKDKSNFYNIAQGSLEELKYYLILINDLGFAENIGLMARADEVGRLLNKLLQSLP